MREFGWLRRLFGSRRHNSSIVASGRPLREFIYLDEVSLRSLLSSQIGEVTDTRSEHRSEGSQLNIDSTVGVRAPGFSKAELGSRYQTSNSSSLQTSRKATVQSWFGDLHAIDGLRIVEVNQKGSPADNLSDVLTVKNWSIVAPADILERGKLVEFRVKLSADPVFHLGTMVAEFSNIVDESPEMFSDAGMLRQLKEFRPIHKVLQRMLAGLVPIRCEALDHVVIKIDGNEYVVRRECLEGLDVECHPLLIVGVTEHLAYWKDLRRVLFSDGAFTILGRVARSGLHTSWTPIKLGDLFRVVAPDWDAQINMASHNPFALASSARKTVAVNEILLSEALSHYRDIYLTAVDRQLTIEQDVALSNEIQRLLQRAGTASGQRSAFQIVHDTLKAEIGGEFTPDEDSAMRDSARTASGLPLFPSLSNGTTTVTQEAPEIANESEPRLIDVEVVAIYW